MRNLTIPRETLQRLAAYSLQDERTRTVIEYLAGAISRMDACERLDVGKDRLTRLAHDFLSRGLLQMKDLSIAALLLRAGATKKPTAARQPYAPYWLDYRIFVSPWLGQKMIEIGIKTPGDMLENPNHLLRISGVGRKKFHSLIKMAERYQAARQGKVDNEEVQAGNPLE